MSTNGSGILSWASAVSNALTDGDIFVGNGSNLAAGVTMSGDATIINTGAITIANNAITTIKILDANVTNAKLANSSLTVTAGDGLQNGGSVSLGSSTTLDVDSTVVRTTGVQSISGPKTFTDSIILEDPGAGTNTVTIQSGVPTTSYTLTLPVDDGLSGEVLTTNGSGILSWTTPSASGITSINGETGSAQTIAVGSAGTDVAIVVTTDTTTINIPTSSGTNTGKLSNTDWTTFNNKLTGTLSDGDIFVGNGSNIATGVTMSGDATIINTGALTISNNAITTIKILDANVTNAKLANSTIGLTTGTIGTDINVSGSPASLGSSLTLNVPDASATARGVVTIGAQTFAGAKTFNNTVTVVGALQSNTSLILEDPGAGTNTVTIQSGVPTASYTLTLPIDDGNNGEVLTTNGSGTLTWGNPPGDGDVTGPGSSTDNAIVRFDGTTGKIIQNSGIIIDDTDNVTGITSLQMPGSVSGMVTIQPPSTITSYTLTLPVDDGVSDQVLQTDGNGLTTWVDVLLISGGTMGGNINMDNTYKVINLPLPTTSGDAASKAYVDSVVGGDPGGITDSIQYKLASDNFGGSSDFLYNDTNKLFYFKMVVKFLVLQLFQGHHHFQDLRLK